MAKALFLLAGLWIGMLDSSVGGSTIPEERETNQLTDVKCDSGATPIITEAYFLHQPEQSPCDDNCKPTDTSSKNSKTCFVDGERCRIRISLDALNRIYKVLDSGDHQQLKEISTDIENDGTKGRYKVKYVYVDGPIVDPCFNEDQLDNKSNKKNNNPVTNLIVTPSSQQPGDLDRAGPPCRKLCRLTPRDEGPQKVVVNFLLNDVRRDDDNYLQYRYVNNTGHATPWSKMTSSYHYGEGVLRVNIKEIQVRLHLEDLSLVTRLWISLQGLAFTVTCEEEGPTVYTDDPVSASLTTQPELSTQDTVDTELGGCDPVLPYALGLGISAVIAMTLGVGLCI